MATSGFDATISALQQGMNLRLTNQNVISSNIANADTPGYKAKRLEFEDTLRSQIGVDDQLRIAGDNDAHIHLHANVPQEAGIVEDANGVESLDGNTVNRGAEMAHMLENQQLYEASAELIKKKLGMLKYAISEGGGNR